MAAYCAPCGRSFKGQENLDQHMQNSSAHNKRPIQRSPQINLQYITPEQEEQPRPSRAKRAEPQKALDSAYRTHNTIPQRKHGKPPNAIVSSSSTPQIKKPVIETASQNVNLPWSVVPVSEFTAVLNALSAHCHSPRELKENGYILDPYNPLDYVNSRKCKRCNSKETNAYDRECIFHPCKRNKWNTKRPYKCCRTEGRGCMILPTHDFQLPLRAKKHRDFLHTPAASAAAPKFRAVTLDCEMAGIASGASEAILLCVTDYLTGAVLLNRFVWPGEKITQMRSSIHGISKSTLDGAVSRGQALSGWEGARSELWKYIDGNTILVGHALEHDLDALRIIHPNVVDSGILARNAVGIPRIRWGLQTLCSELLNFEIRKNKGGIHDCLEDVLATREVVLFCTRSKEVFQSWAEATKSEEIRLEKEREIARQKGKEKQVKEGLVMARGGTSSHEYFHPDDVDEEVLHWSDIAEDLGWPHPDTGYDPWSD